MCGKFSGIIENTTSNLMNEFYSAIRNHLKPLVIPKLTKDKIKKITIGFESLHGIPYILGAINGSHIPIVAPKVDPKPYYYKSGFVPH
jgi:retron-type reverse transcriptase